MDVRRNWRRIAGGIGFILAVGWLAGHKACESDSATGVVHFKLGERAAEVRSVRAELRRGDDPEVLGYWEMNYGERGSRPDAGSWSLHADAGTYWLDVVVRTASASARITRGIDLRDGAQITVDLSDAVR